MQNLSLIYMSEAPETSKNVFDLKIIETPEGKKVRVFRLKALWAKIYPELVDKLLLEIQQNSRILKRNKTVVIFDTGSGIYQQMEINKSSLELYKISDLDYFLNHSDANIVLSEIPQAKVKKLYRLSEHFAQTYPQIPQDADLEVMDENSPQLMQAGLKPLKYEIVIRYYNNDDPEYLIVKKAALVRQEIPKTAIERVTLQTVNSVQKTVEKERKPRVERLLKVADLKPNKTYEIHHKFKHKYTAMIGAMIQIVSKEDPNFQKLRKIFNPGPNETLIKIEKNGKVNYGKIEALALKPSEQ